MQMSEEKAKYEVTPQEPEVSLQDRELRIWKKGTPYPYVLKLPKALDLKAQGAYELIRRDLTPGEYEALGGQYREERRIRQINLEDVDPFYVWIQDKVKVILK